MRSVRGAALLAIAILMLDQWTKRWATLRLAGERPIHVIGDLVQFTYTRNSGVAFGLGAGTHFPYWVFSGLAAIGIVVMLARRPELPLLKRVALSLVLGGALGNLIDRVRFGEVVDFILLSWRQWQFPVFNVADSAVSIGVALFALSWSRSHDDEHEPESEPAEAADAGTPGSGEAGG
jgi:signal peptidase II